LTCLAACRTGDKRQHIQWGDIDFNGEFIEVHRGVVMGKETTTKSDKIRRIDMSRQLQEELKRLKAIRQIKAMNYARELAP
jgi:integrase